MAETYTGEVRNVVVVFEGSPPPDGTRVTVEPVAMPAELRSLADRLRNVIGKAEGLSADMAEQHDHYLHGLPKR